ncbi:MAG: zinc ribbon domain-containing protein [Prevotella sp.]|nr:zinc ribbon domain-containing protein [Prevotella sp.]
MSKNLKIIMVSSLTTAIILAGVYVLIRFMVTIECQQCGYPQSEVNNFCGNCGYPLGVPLLTIPVDTLAVGQ